jgi:hypothetical protein
MNTINSVKIHLSDRALAYYKRLPNKTRVLAALLEIAAGDDRLARDITRRLRIYMPIERRGKACRVSDDALIQLRDQGLSQGAIGEAAGLSRQQVNSRLKKIKTQKSCLGRRY